MDWHVRKVLNGEYDAIVLAKAELASGTARHIGKVFPLDVMLPAPGQEPAVQCRAAVVKHLNCSHPSMILSAAAVDAERAPGGQGWMFAPVAAFGEKNNNHYSESCRHFRRRKTSHPPKRRGSRPHQLGKRLAELVLGRGGGVLNAGVGT
jgi:porphobilinogen deaminase